MIAGFLLVALVVLTSALAYLIGRRRLNLRLREVPEALGRMIECLGVVLVFYLANVVMGMVVVLLLRSLTPVSLSLYRAADPAFLMLSLLQGWAFHFWVRPVRLPMIPERS